MKTNQILLPSKFINVSNEDVESTAMKTLGKLGVEAKIVEIEPISKGEIAKINFEYRDKNEATDVLSFALNQTPSEKNILGNIFICEEVAKERKGDVLELVKHGILHLLGYDHETNQASWDKTAKKINHNM